MITLNDALWTNDDGELANEQAGDSLKESRVMTIEMCCWSSVEGPNVGWPMCGQP